MKDETKKTKPIFKYILIVIIFIFIILISIVLYYNRGKIKNTVKNTMFKEEVVNVKCDYIYLNDRPSYIIKTVDENFLSNYYGNSNTMIVFSASWCKYCVAEQNELNNFIINNPDKKIIVVSHDKSYEELENYLKTNNFNWYVIFDKDKTIRENIDPGSKGIPCTYLLNKNGKIIGYSKGEKKEAEFLQFYNNEIGIYNSSL